MPLAGLAIHGKMQGGGTEDKSPNQPNPICGSGSDLLPFSGPMSMRVMTVCTPCAAEGEA